LGRSEGINELRGRFFPWKGGIEVFPMFHPSYLLRNPSSEKGSPKYLTWQDIKAVKARILSLRSPTPAS
jgi:DNA polymerase